MPCEKGLGKPLFILLFIDICDILNFVYRCISCHDAMLLDQRLRKVQYKGGEL